MNISYRPRNIDGKIPCPVCHTRMYDASKFDTCYPCYLRKHRVPEEINDVIGRKTPTGKGGE